MAFLEPIVGLSLDEIAQRWWQWSDPTEAPTDLVEEQALFDGFWDILANDLQLTPEQRARLYQFDYTTIVKAHPDARPALLAARQHGLRVGVLSNFELASIDASLESAGLADLVDCAFAAPVIGVAKPDVEAYLTVSRALGVPAEQCLYFDDELPSVEGARAAGMHAYHVNRDLTEHDLGKNMVCNLSVIPLLFALS